MIWLIVAGIVVVVVFVVWFVVGGSGIAKEYKQRFEQGVRATATIDEAEQPGPGDRVPMARWSCAST